MYIYTYIYIYIYMYNPLGGSRPALGPLCLLVY